MKKSSSKLTILSSHENLQDRSYYKADFSVSLKVRNTSPVPSVFLTRDYALILCLKGSVSFVFNMEKKVNLYEKCLIFLTPNNLWQLMDNTPDAEFYVCSLSQDFFSQLHFHTHFNFRAKHIENPILQLDENNMRTCKQYFELMYSLVQTPPSELHKLVIIDLLQSFFNHFTHCYKIQTSAAKQHSAFKRSDQIFGEFYKLMDQYALQEHSIRFYAKQLNITEHNLSNAVKRATQKTPKDWLDARILHQAKTLLLDSTKTIYQISDELHFATPSHFGFFFKKHTGVTPKQYRGNLFADTSALTSQP